MPDSANYKTQQAAKELDILFGGFSCAGQKPENQDAFAAHQPGSQVRQVKGSVVCIADGVSCSDQAQQASQTSVTTFIQDYFSTPDSWTVKESVAKILSSLNSWMYHHSQQASYKQNGLVTTFSGAIFKSNTAYLFHIGDSRIYLFREGKLRQLTKDHCHLRNDRSSFLTRALGMDSHLEVDFSQLELEKGDVLLLTTDGVHESLSTSQLEVHLQEKDQGLEWVSKQICQHALEAGSEDNLSCFLAVVNNLPSQDIEEVHRQLTALKIPPVLAVGQKIDDYRVERVIHAGARSHLYLVTDVVTNENLVLKAPSANFEEDLTYLEGFIREQWIGSRIQHKSIMKVFPRTERNQNSPFLYHICEYVPGKTLRQWMYDNPEPSLTQVRAIGQEIIQALRVFQRQSMVHRDLKPENIMINEAGQITLIDFGTVQVKGLSEIASPIEEEVPVGAVHYIAPEYLLGNQGSHRSDQFSLGVILYEMLTGRLPFKPPVIQRHQVTSTEQWTYRSAVKVREDIPRWMDLALQKACQSNPVHRYPAYSELLVDLKRPNGELIQKLENAPLLERNPLAFWKMLSGVLFTILVLQSVLCYLH